MTSVCRRLCVAAGLAALISGCGSDPAPAPPAGAPAEPTYLAGVHASDIAKAMRLRGLVCAEPRKERDFSHWVCEVETPLLGYMTEYYGKAPGRIEYIRVVVSQRGAPKIEQITPLMMEVANLRYTDVDRAAAKTWVEQNLQTGGQTRIGPAKFKFSGDLSRLILEVKAPGSEW